VSVYRQYTWLNKVQVAQPEDGNEKVDEHDGSDEDVYTEHRHCEPRFPGTAWHIRVIQVQSAVVTAALHIA